MTTYKSQLVGMHFRPPAKAVLAHLASGCQLSMFRETDNPYDEYAIQVRVEPSAVPESQCDDLANECASMGKDWTGIVAEGQPVHLGYLISAGNKKLGAWTPNTTIWDLINENRVVATTLGFDEQGVAFVLVEASEQ